MSLYQSIQTTLRYDHQLRRICEVKGQDGYGPRKFREAVGDDSPRRLIPCMYHNQHAVHTYINIIPRNLDWLLLQPA